VGKLKVLSLIDKVAEEDEDNDLEEDSNEDEEDKALEADFEEDVGHGTMPDRCTESGVLRTQTPQLTLDLKRPKRCSTACRDFARTQ